MRDAWIDLERARRLVVWARWVGGRSLRAGGARGRRQLDMQWVDLAPPGSLAPKPQRTPQRPTQIVHENEAASTGRKRIVITMLVDGVEVVYKSNRTVEL